MSWNKNRTVFFLWFNWFLKWKSVWPEYYTCVSVFETLVFFRQKNISFGKDVSCIVLDHKVVNAWKVLYPVTSLSLTRRCHYSSLKLTSAFCRDRLVGSILSECHPQLFYWVAWRKFDENRILSDACFSSKQMFLSWASWKLKRYCLVSCRQTAFLLSLNFE